MPESYVALTLKLSLYDRFIHLFVWMGVKLFGKLVNFKLFRPLSDKIFATISQSLWDWRTDFSASNDPVHQNTQRTHDKNGVCNPLRIPYHLIPTSHLSTEKK